jgi:hypothetical protein
MGIKGSMMPTSGTDRPFYYYDYNYRFKDLITNGIATRGEALTTQMQASAVAGTMKSQVALGVAYTNGIRSEVHTAAEQVTHDAANVSNPRIDLVCLEAYPDPAGGVRDSRIIIVKGTAAGSPTAPDASLVQTDSQYQYPLAEVLIPTGETDASNFTYTDRRAIAQVPLSFIAANVAIADAGSKFTATDVETVLQEIAGDSWVTTSRINDGAVTKAKFHADALDWTLIANASISADPTTINIASQAGKSEMLLVISTVSADNGAVYASLVLPLLSTGKPPCATAYMIGMQSDKATLDVRQVYFNSATEIKVYDTTDYGSSVLSYFRIYTR